MNIRLLSMLSPRHSILTLLMIVGTHSVRAEDWGPGHFMRQALETVIDTATDIWRDTGEDLDNRGVSLLGAFLEDGEEVSWITTLYSGEEYVFVGGGDEDVNDLDISVYDDDGDLVNEDVLEDNYPIVRVAVRRTARYKITLDLYDADRGSFCAMAILRDGAPTIPLDRIEEAMDRYLEMAERVNDLSDEGADFHDEDNQWALFGAILDEDESTSISGLSLESRNHLILAAGDDRADDVDLFLYDDDDDLLVEDTETDSTPVISHRTRSSQSYKLKIENYESNGRSLIFATILDI